MKSPNKLIEFVGAGYVHPYPSERHKVSLPLNFLFCSLAFKLIPQFWRKEVYAYVSEYVWWFERKLGPVHKLKTNFIFLTSDRSFWPVD